MKVTDLDIFVVNVPQIPPIAPYRSRYRSTSTTLHAIVRVDTDEGLTGWGEFNLNFLTDVSGRKMRAEALAWARGRDPLNIHRLHAECKLETALKSGIEMAFWDISGKALGVPVAVLLGGILRPRVEVAACMGIQSYKRAGEIAAMYVEQGFGTLKTKAGFDMREDLEMVRGIRDAVGDKLKLRIDPNTGYSAQQAAELAKQLEQYNLEYFEQPTPEGPLSDIRWLREQTTVPIALNESVTGPGSVIDILKADAAAFILPDTHIAGGVLPCVIIGRVCEAAGIPCIMHCSHDLGPKTAVMIHVAAACPSYSLANDTTYYGLEDDVILEKLPISNGTMAVPNKPGLGIEGDPERIARFRVDC